MHIPVLLLYPGSLPVLWAAPPTIIDIAWYPRSAAYPWNVELWIFSAPPTSMLIVETCNSYNNIILLILIFKASDLLDAPLSPSEVNICSQNVATPSI
jgi:hypothetical protein